MKYQHIDGITDKEGVSKDKILKEKEQKYGLNGILQYNGIGNSFYFYYKNIINNSVIGLMISSAVDEYEFVEKDNLHIITTQNSIYYILNVIE